MASFSLTWENILNVFISEAALQVSKERVDYLVNVVAEIDSLYTEKGSCIRMYWRPNVKSNSVHVIEKKCRNVFLWLYIVEEAVILRSVKQKIWSKNCFGSKNS